MLVNLERIQGRDRLIQCLEISLACSEELFACKGFLFCLLHTYIWYNLLALLVYDTNFTLPFLTQPTPGHICDHPSPSAPFHPISSPPVKIPAPWNLTLLFPEGIIPNSGHQTTAPLFFSNPTQLTSFTLSICAELISSKKSARGHLSYLLCHWAKISSLHMNLLLLSSLASHSVVLQTKSSHSETASPTVPLQTALKNMVF